MLWLANKPDSKYEGKMKVVQVESTNKDAGKACVGDRVKIEREDGWSAAFENYEKEEEENEDGTVAKKKKGRSLMGIASSVLFSEQDDEMNLPEHVRHIPQRPPPPPPPPPQTCRTPRCDPRPLAAPPPSPRPRGSPH